MPKASSNTPKWLKRAQKNSWEPEIFVSGIVLYGLFQLPEYIQDFTFFFKREITSNGPIDSILGLVLTGIFCLTWGLILHLFMRGIWVGLVGLSYIFPNGIQNNNLGYKGKFKKRVENLPTIQSQIIRLEKLCSSLFSISYFGFMCIIGTLTFMIATVIIPVTVLSYVFGFTPQELFRGNSIFLIYYVTSLILSIIYLVDFLTLGPLKRWKWSSKIYYPIYAVISILTLSPLYRNIYYVLISSFKKWKIILFIFGFLIITFFGVRENGRLGNFLWHQSRINYYGFSKSHSTSPETYDIFNYRSGFKRGSIQSDIIKDDVLRLFITHRADHEDSIMAVAQRANIKNWNSDEKMNSSEIDSLKLAGMKLFYQVSVDDSLYADQKWLFFNEPINNQRGILTYVDISNISKGTHYVSIDLSWGNGRNYDVIHFYKE
ncbi:MAG: hypothetical protein JXQ96_09165 [Cyclobacteriaceae bacterium]